MTAPTFVEQFPHEMGFARVFAREIAPELERVERGRQRCFRTFMTRVGVSAGLLSALAAAVLVLPVPLGVALKVLPTAVIVGLVIAAIWAHAPYKKFQAGLRSLLVGPICRFLGDLEYTRKPNWGYGPLQFRKLGVVPRYSRAEVEDMFEGTHRGTGFRLAEARLIRGAGRYQKTVFDGLLFEIEVPVAFKCRILILRNRGLVGNLIAEASSRWFSGRLGKMTRIHFGEPPFERRFVVYADDAEAARSLMTPGFRATLVALTKDYRPRWWRSLWRPFGRKTLAAAFAHKKFFLALPARGNLFEVGSVLRSAYGCERDIRRFMRDVVRARQVIDYLHGERPAQSARQPVDEVTMAG